MSTANEPVQRMAAGGGCSPCRAPVAAAIADLSRSAESRI